MFEYAAFNPYNSSPEALAGELTKKSAEGWEVVSIVPTTDGRYCAFLRRATNDTTNGVANATGAQTANMSALNTSNGTSEVPAAWYADPSNRFELRYWNGKEWTEHVARAGQQFTDPPVA
ncbi:hypothetical protein EMGBS4_15420 [Acidimicrobiaceae bacterium]|nr:hypothetical protein EMGBS4_15420 [Acidimicrobiaceae bacterium]